MSGWKSVFLARVVLSILLHATVGPSMASAMASICNELPSITTHSSAQDIANCARTSDGRTFDFLAFSMCRELTTYSVKGAKGSDVTNCLGTISGKRFNYKKLRSCRGLRNNSDQVIGCIRKSTV